MTNWIKVDDTTVRMIWICPICNNEVFVDPSCYENVGTPVCTNEDVAGDICDADMTYDHTEIDTSGLPVDSEAKHIMDPSDVEYWGDDR